MIPMNSIKAFISTRWSKEEISEEDTCSPSTPLSETVDSATSSECANEDTAVTMVPKNMLMAFRFSADDDTVKVQVCKAKLPPPTYESNPSSKSKIVLPARHHRAVQPPTPAPLTPTAGSWSAQKRSTSGNNLDDDEQFARAARSILNKITAETFDSLFEKLVNCGIEQPKHISKLMSAVFDVATKQHHFIPMYADLCMKLEVHPNIAAAVEVAGNQHAFRRLLLNQCQVVFEQLLEPCNCELVLDDEMALVRKQEALGNIKLIGHLLVNGMLDSKMLVQCADELISKRTSCPEALESLSALMMVAAPTFDTAKWQHHEKLVSVFNVMRKLTKDKSAVPRSRFLLRDVLDVREAGWPTSTKNPSVIGEEIQGSDQEASSKLNVLDTSKVDTSPEVSDLAPATFDLKGFRRTLAAILNDLTSDRNVAGAVNRVRAAQVPLECQAEQFSDIITRIVEEKRGPPRRCAMAFAAGLAAAEQSAFDRDQCLDGLVTFFRDVYPDLCSEVPRLPAIVRSELTPTFCSVFQKADINNRLPPGVRF